MCTHMRRSNLEKLFKCNHCNYEGIQTAILDSHIQSTHNNLWYHCDLCEYKANHKCNITKHVQIKHEGLVFGCDDCDNKSTLNARVAAPEESQHEGIKRQTRAQSAQGIKAFRNQICLWPVRVQINQKTIAGKAQGVKHNGIKLLWWMWLWSKNQKYS